MITRPTGLAVHRFQTIPVHHDALPATVIYSVAEEDSRDTLDDTYHRTFLLRLEHRIAPLGPHPTESRDPPDDQVEPLILWARQQIFGDATLAGLVLDLMEAGRIWDWAPRGEDVYFAVAQDFQVLYESAEADVQDPSIRGQILARVETILNEGA